MIVSRGLGDDTQAVDLSIQPVDFGQVSMWAWAGAALALVVIFGGRRLFGGGKKKRRRPDYYDRALARKRRN